MNNLPANVEELAVSALMKEVSHHDLLKPEFSTMDKKPLWDGNIYVYNSLPQSKETLNARIPVQIKGKSIKRFSRKTRAIEVNINNLHNYKKEGGVMYFVVEILAISKKAKIFCKNLLPYDIINILKHTKKKQKNITIHLPELNKNKESLYIECLNFLHHHDKQRHVETINIDEIECIKGFEVSGISANNPNSHFFDNILESELYVYAIAPNNLKIPIGQGALADISTELERNITVNGTCYYEKQKVKYVKSGTYVHLGSSLMLYIGKPIGKIDYTPKGDIASILHDTSFLISAMVNNGFYIDNEFMPLPDSSYAEDKSAILSKLKKMQIWLTELKALFSLLELDFITEYETLTETDMRKLEELIQRYIRKDIQTSSQDLTGLNCVRLCDRTVVFFQFIMNNEKSIINIFSKDFSKKIRMGTGPLYSNSEFFSPYCLLHYSHISNAYNFNKELIMNSLKENPLTDATAPQYINLLIHIIKACDDSQNKKDIIELAQELSQYLLDYDRSNTNLLNWLQVRKRVYGNLTSEEVCTIKQMIEEELSASRTNHEIICGAKALLGDISGFNQYFSMLDTERQKEFKEYPIHTLLNISSS